MNSWIFGNIEVYEIDHDADLHAFSVYNGDEKLGTIYPNELDDMNACIEALNAGSNPIEDGWEDGCGNTCSLDGWGE